MSQLLNRIEDEQSLSIQLQKKIKELQVMCEYVDRLCRERNFVAGVTQFKTYVYNSISNGSNLSFIL